VVGKSVIVDTNALLLPGEFGVDIFAELGRLGYVHALIPRAVLTELERLSVSPGATGRERRAAALGRSLLEQVIRSTDQTHASFGLQVSIVAPAEEGEAADAGGAGEAGGDTDALIVALAVREKAAVLTNDEELRKTLARAGIVTVYLRGGTRLEERE
jgi:rRNA-processing protein FCF1